MAIGRTFNIHNPSFIGNIAGPQSVGTSYGDFSTYSLYPVGGPREYVWSVTGPFLKGGSKNSVNSIFVNTSQGYGSGNIYVYARNTCGQTSVVSKYITVGTGYPSSADGQWEEVTEPVIIAEQGNPKVIVPHFEDVERVAIYNMNGELVESFVPQEVETELNSFLVNEIYVVKTIRHDGHVLTSKSRVNQ